MNKGADLERKNLFGENVLMISVRYKNADIIEFILENCPVDLSVKNTSWKSVLEYLSYYDCDENISSLFFKYCF